MRPKRNVELASGRAMGPQDVCIGAAVVGRVIGISESPLFHNGSLATDMLYAESCAASAALNSVPESQLASAPDLFSIDRDTTR